MVGNPSGASRVVVIVLNWNRPAETIACLDSLAQLVERPPVLVVDNGSTDDSAVQIVGHHPWVAYLSLDRNRGFSGGMNAGILEVLSRPNRPEFVWLLNNDTILEPGALDSMVVEADAAPRVGAVGSVLLDPTGKHVREWGGGSLNRTLWTSSRITEPLKGQVDYISGASMLLRTEALLQIGLFDERFFFYWEDADLCLRLTNGGWLLSVAMESRVRHTRGASVGGSVTGGTRVNALYAQSLATFIATWARGRFRGPLLALRLMAAILRRLARGQIRMLPSIVRAYSLGVRIGKQKPLIPRPGASLG